MLIYLFLLISVMNYVSGLRLLSLIVYRNYNYIDFKSVLIDHLVSCDFYKNPMNCHMI